MQQSWYKAGVQESACFYTPAMNNQERRKLLSNKTCVKTDYELPEHTNTKLQLTSDLTIKAEPVRLRRKLSDCGKGRGMSLTQWLSNFKLHLNKPTSYVNHEPKLAVRRVRKHQLLTDQNCISWLASTNALKFLPSPPDRVILAPRVMSYRMR